MLAFFVFFVDKMSHILLAELSRLLHSALSVSPGAHLTAFIFPEVQLHSMSAYRRRVCVVGDKRGGYLQKAKEKAVILQIKREGRKPTSLLMSQPQLSLLFHLTTGHPIKKNLPALHHPINF